MNNLGLTQEQVTGLLYEESVHDKNDNEIFDFVSKKFVSNDTEKSHVDYKITIKEVATGKYWQAVLGESPWYLQDKHNAEQTWVEVKPKEIKTINYE